MATSVARAPLAPWASSHMQAQTGGDNVRREVGFCVLAKSSRTRQSLHVCTRSSFNGRQIKRSCKPYSQPVAGRTVTSASLGNFFNRSDEKPEASAPPYFEDAEQDRVRQSVAIRLKRAASEFRRWGNWGFWVQLVTAVVSAVILAFSVAITGQATNAISAYLTAGGIVAAFISVFNFFRFSRLARTFEESAENPDKAPSRAAVIKKLSNGLILNMVGLAATLLGAQATVGLLVAKALTSQSQPYLANTPQGFSPVLALDVFLVQASFNVVTAHFFGLLFQLLLLRSTTTSPPPPESVIPKPA
ncbi:chloroplast import appara [Klebsormidium nitens]|uniref:Chloroplast import appara n=1 Tax=Klebsormidium nitens TaxID=105231 RepID=A0A1Y1ILL9_KLENI|nr:chloroplast import appara [Klebsormidium nitens]|eukprot:GAQ89666.1 chloroplast import appara [Klebsormidium nitens]